MRDQLRRELKERRAAAALKYPDAAAQLREQFKTITLPANGVCAGYVAIRDEMDPAQVMSFLSEQRMQLSLPVVVSDNTPLEFRAYEIGDELNSDSIYKIPEPHADKAVVEPMIILVPLLGFDRRGNRLGSGKGLYDRTLTALRARQAVIAIGLAFAEQELPQIPAEKHDACLNLIVTPRGVIYCSPS